MMSQLPRELLLVEDDEEFREMAAQWMTRKGHLVEQAANGQEALLKLSRRRFDVAVVDMNMPGISGLELLHRIRDLQYETEIIVLTGQATVDNAVQAMKEGAFDYLTKPCPLADLERRCMAAADHIRLSRENQQLRDLLNRTQRRNIQMVGSCPAMKNVNRLIGRAAPTDKTVLIEGESGTGKELVALAIQEQSERVMKPFVTVNCAALPETLVESELFGHEKGSFTGAAARKHGLFESADGGTLFIDEIGELPLALQPKLLRILENGSFRPVGSQQERRVNVRIIAATNRDLLEEVEAGRFREDLYYRINVLSIKLPPLRERGDDLELLVDHFLGDEFQLEEDARQRLLAYDWPGNVRQLINALDRGKILAEDHSITLDDLPSEICNAEPRSSSMESVHEDSIELAAIEKHHIESVLNQCQGNKALAARTLKIHRRKLYRLIDKYELGKTPPEKI